VQHVHAGKACADHDHIAVLDIGGMGFSGRGRCGSHDNASLRSARQHSPGVLKAQGEIARSFLQWAGPCCSTYPSWHGQVWYTRSQEVTNFTGSETTMKSPVCAMLVIEFPLFAFSH